MLSITKKNADGVISDVGKKARLAQKELCKLSVQKKKNILCRMSEVLMNAQVEILDANKDDVKKAKDNGMSESKLDRLAIDEQRVVSMAESLRAISNLPEIVGEISDIKSRSSGIRVGRMRVPLGVVAMIYEARPDVTVEASGLCFKSGNAVILRGSSDAVNTNSIIVQCLQSVLNEYAVAAELIQLLPVTDRSLVTKLAQAVDYVDLLIPRGGRGLIESVINKATVPVIRHLEGNCHVYIDEYADLQKGVKIVVNAKTQRHGTCNSIESLLIHRSIADSATPLIVEALRGKKVEIKACERIKKLVPDIQLATENDYRTEYLGPYISAKIVDSLGEAIEHINNYGSGHSDAIVTENLSVVNRFLREIDSSSVLVNASTRFADGGQYGLGAEIGISTNKLHARGPVGQEGLTSQKWIVFGDGHIRE